MKPIQVILNGLHPLEHRCVHHRVLKSDRIYFIDPQAYVDQRKLHNFHRRKVFRTTNILIKRFIIANHFHLCLFINNVIIK